jgi:hypothetical protein
MHFPWAADASCSGIVIDDAAKVRGRRSLSLSGSTYCEHQDSDKRNVHVKALQFLEDLQY